MFQSQEQLNCILALIALSVFYAGYIYMLGYQHLKTKPFLKFIMPCMVLVTLFPSCAGLFIYLLC